MCRRRAVRTHKIRTHLPLHPFDIAKYEKIHQQLLADGVVEAGATLEPSALDDQDLRLVHTADYLDRLKVRKNIAKYLEAEMLLAVPLSLEKHVLQPFRLASGGTLLAARHALESGIGINLPSCQTQYWRGVLRLRRCPDRDPQTAKRRPR